MSNLSDHEREQAAITAEWEANNPTPPRSFDYRRWRHGGWYVGNVCYPSGAVGCVSRNYTDGKWRIVCDERDFDDRPTFKTRDAAALAEWHIAQAEKEPAP